MSDKRKQEELKIKIDVLKSIVERNNQIRDGVKSEISKYSGALLGMNDIVSVASNLMGGIQKELQDLAANGTITVVMSNFCMTIANKIVSAVSDRVKEIDRTQCIKMGELKAMELSGDELMAKLSQLENELAAFTAVPVELSVDEVKSQVDIEVPLIEVKSKKRGKQSKKPSPPQTEFESAWEKVSKLKKNAK